MKKTIVLGAVLAAFGGAAVAQSSVTLFGVIDANVRYVKTGSTNLKQVGTDGLSASRLGVRGTEDLGGGLKAMFKLENRFNIDDGTSVGGFSGDAYVALAGGFGTVKLGRTAPAFDDVRAMANSKNVFDSDLTPTGAVFGMGVALVNRDKDGVAIPGAVVGLKGTDYTSRAANGIRYESPVMGGVSGALTYAFGEDETATKDANDLVSLNLKYAAGPLAVGLGYQKEKAAGATSNKYTALSGSYDFGMAALSAGYQKRNGTAASGDDKGYTLGVTMPLGSAMNVSLGYASEETKVAGATVADNSGWALGLGYSMSKRTTLFAGFQDVSQENAAGAEVGKQRIVAAGLRHDF